MVYKLEHFLNIKFQRAVLVLWVLNLLTGMAEKFTHLKNLGVLASGGC